VFVATRTGQSEIQVSRLQLADKLANLIGGWCAAVILVHQILFDGSSDGSPECFRVNAVIRRTFGTTRINGINVRGACLYRAFQWCKKLVSHLPRDYRLNCAVSHPAFDFQRTERARAPKKPALIFLAR
jgi:hypothetical protein